MRYLVISDIHASLEGMEACLADAPPYDRVLNLGDVVGYGASPNEVVERSRKIGSVFVRGNHDKACSGITDASDFNMIAGLAAYWTKQHLTSENLEWVKALPEGPILGDDNGFQIVHGSPLDEDEYIIVVRDSYEPLQRSNVPLTFFGHTHIQGGFCQDGEEWVTIRPIYQTMHEPEQFRLQLKPGAKYLINPGSAGQPRDGDWRVACALYDSAAQTIDFCRVPYNIEDAQKKIIAAGLPDRLASRLTEGR